MADDKSFQPKIIPLNLSEAARQAGIEEMLIENNIVVVIVKLPDVEAFTERVTINHKRWHIMVRTLMKAVRNILSVKGVDKIYVNEIGVQIANTLNQNDNYQLITRIANQLPAENEGSFHDDAKVLANLALMPENTELFFKDQYGEPYVAVRVGNDKHLEIMQLQSKKYECYLIKLFFEDCDKRIIGKDAVNRALNLLQANTIFGDNIIPLNIRVAWGTPENRAGSDCIYYDMSDSPWRIIKIAQDGWKIVRGNDTSVPILFKRYNQTPQVEPSTDYDADVFERFLDLTNVRNEKQRQLLKVYIISLLVPEIDHVILTTYGPKGAAKTFLLWLIKMLVDPSKPVLLTLLRNIPEFIQQVNHNYLAFYDNVKYIPYWLSDEICKVVTGIGHTKRKLYTDEQDIILEHRHCIAINGIDVALTETDAMDRSLIIKLEEIRENNIKKKADLVKEFERIKPKLLGFIFDTLVKAMKIKQTLRLLELSRMADFTEWGEAISRALEYDDMSFVKAYRENRNEQNIVAVEENLVGRILVKFYNNYEERNNENPKFVGSPEELHKELMNYAEQNDIPIQNHQFPKAANILVKKLNAIKSNLADAYGIILNVSRDKENNSSITISRLQTENHLEIPPANRVIQNYYDYFVQRQHTHNCDLYNSMTQTHCITEATSDTSEPPVKGKAFDSQSGGSEVPEVDSSTMLLESDKLHNQTSQNQTTDSDSEIFESFKNDLLEEIRSANGSTVSVPSVIESLCKSSESRRKYIGTNPLRDNDKLKKLHLAVIRCQKVEVIAKTPELCVKWIEPTSTDEKCQS